MVTSIGRRTKIVEYFKKELGGKGNLIAADFSSLAPALYKADNHYLVPRIEDPKYIDSLKMICKKEKIDAIISLIDPELSVLSKNSKVFEEIGVRTIVSPFDVCELCIDKYKTYKFFHKHGFKYAKTYNSFSEFEDAFQRDEISFPVIVKPQKGSASLNFYKARDMNEAKIFFESSNGMLIQEFLDGKELGVDVYVDLISKKVVSVFIKEKIAMRAGETDKAKSIRSDALFIIIEELVTKAGLVGPIDIDVFEINGEYYISEINPRFGGGYLLAYECGVNFPKFIIKNLKGLVNETHIGEYEENIYMMKHDNLTLIKGDLLI